MLKNNLKPKKISPSLFQCVNLLKDGEFHLGDDLGHQLNMSRTGIWKIMNALKNHGVDLEIRKSEGYKLKNPLLLLDPEKIKTGIGEDFILEVFESLGSTNTYLLNTEFSNQPRICLTEVQTEGKGRLGRAWKSSFGQNLLFSYLYPFDDDVSKLNGLSLVIAVSLMTGIHNYNPQNNLKIKWPNDLYLNNKKLGGILIELRAESHSQTKVVIGVGLNINQEIDADFEKDLMGREVSVLAKSGEYLDRNNLIIILIKQLAQDLKIFEKEGLSYFLEKFDQLDFLKSKKINLKHHCFSQDPEIVSGIAMGIDQQGFLKILKDDGTLQKFSAGDTSLNGF